jgi:glucosamine--fructose-6-phosphate aminotransferase (isomerizing)
MCGIVGYVGAVDAVDFLVSGLHRLEYRGYDSAGVATTTPSGDIAVVKAAGRIERLKNRLASNPLPGSTGIGHTRWATHGAANDVNAHPHFGGDGVLAVVHNGVIENFEPIKERLQAEGYEFSSSTDTEVIAHLIAGCLKRHPPVEDMAAAAGRDDHARRTAEHDGQAVSSLQQRQGFIDGRHEWSVFAVR